MSEVETVLIVGGGIAGPTLGRALHREGLKLKVELIECCTEGRAEGGGIGVQPNGMRALRTLGLYGAVERSGHRLRCSFCDEAGEILSQNDLVIEATEPRYVITRFGATRGTIVRASSASSRDHSRSLIPFSHRPYTDDISSLPHPTTIAVAQHRTPGRGADASNR